MKPHAIKKFAIGVGGVSVLSTPLKNFASTKPDGKTIPHRVYGNINIKVCFPGFFQISCVINSSSIFRSKFIL